MTDEARQTLAVLLREYAAIFLPEGRRRPVSGNDAVTVYLRAVYDGKDDVSTLRSKLVGRPCGEPDAEFRAFLAKRPLRHRPKNNASWGG